MNKIIRRKNFWIFVSVLIVIGLLVFLYLIWQKNSLTARAYENYLDRNMSQSENLYERAEKYWFLNAEENFNYALVLYINKNNIQKAITKYDLAYKKKYREYESLNNIANCYRELLDIEKAKQYYIMAIEHSNSEKSGYVNLINMMIKNNLEYSHYLKQAEDNLEIQDIVDLYLTIIESYVVKKDDDMIASYIREVDSHDPDNEIVKKYKIYYEQ